MTEVTHINRQSYMAEVSNLLGLITDEETRARLITQMEQMFDAAEDEQALIEQIGSPTKVAVALIRYADTKKAEAAEAAPDAPIPEDLPEAAPVETPAPAIEINAEEALFPESAFDDELPAVEVEFADNVMPESAYDDELPESAFDDELPAFDEVLPEAPEFAPEEVLPEEAEFAPEEVLPEEPEFAPEEVLPEEAEFAPEADELPAFQEAELETEPVAVSEIDELALEAELPESAEAPMDTDALLAEIEQVVMAESGEVDDTVLNDPIEAAFEAAFQQDLEAFPAPAPEDEAEAEAEAFEAEAEAEAANVPDLAEVLRRADSADDQDAFDPGEITEIEPEPDYETRAIGWRVILYLLIPGIVIGLPIFLALFAVSLVLICLGVATIAAAIGVFSTAFIGFNVVADMLLLLGGGASAFAVALVLLWLGIWFLIAVCFGWVRLITRLGVRFTRKEVPVE